MAEPLKNLLHPGLVTDMASHVSRVAPGFDAERFSALATDGMDTLELMQRAERIKDALAQTLPADFAAAADILRKALPDDTRPGLSGWALLPVNQFVSEYGLGHFDLSLALLKALTPHFTAEFGIRRFIHAEQDRALAEISGWVTDINHHVRRLASEGTRPRLPWAMRLPALVKQPAPILPILVALIDDPEDYVRRSVANSLNDIAKDHPALVADFVERHIDDASIARRQLLRHASRTLLKKGNAKALANFGFAAARGIDTSLTLATPVVVFGDTLGFSITVGNEDTMPQRLMIDYAIHHVKANGTLAPKVFKWKTLDLPAGGRQSIDKAHAIRAITTRVYYPGRHRIEILINGTVSAAADFDLRMD
ncbi:DNA alkylation repair protein [Shinella sp. CPCC 101442]|uniref:DNA alkylation repair protein n=1 Tax=Shinella sp. CPCC 101442 TaxID=2932265 RepID=UPI002153246C|nr:DNA alkylation repair protein [Shinella sp. CPCC 101442]MCR6500351.1 DNA alkylation repair protein [Shinella sp. CPCC 101442]